jgi:hypothetical protein
MKNTHPSNTLPSLTPEVGLAAHLPRWRGFNLLEKFTLEGNAPYQEWDLDFMAQWGFDFIRLPTDYRIWTTSKGVYNEKPLKEIDQVIAWARARKIHVNLCLHRAPGYCVNQPPEPLNLWADGDDGEEARHQFAAQWGMFAERYRGIPPQELSFDLVNEPADIEVIAYVRAATAAVEAIRQADPARLVIADGLRWGRQPVPELLPLGIAQSARGYDPMQISHYKAEWINASDQWPVPQWPMPPAVNSYLYGDEKQEYRQPLVIKGDFSTARKVTITIDQVSHFANLVIRADGEIILEKRFEPAAGEGEWQSSAYMAEWDIYQATYNRNYSANLPAGASELRFELTQGDWLTFSRMQIEPFNGLANDVLTIQPGDAAWAVRQGEFIIDTQGRLSSASGQGGYNRQSMWDELVAPWVALAGQGCGVHVGEWGTYNLTPHAVTMAWMADCLENWRQAGFGWALWNLRGTFGLLDSGRTDVKYENYQGHQLDRKMLDMLVAG